MDIKIQYLVTELDTFIDLARALDDKSWARLFTNLGEAEDYAKEMSGDEVIGIHTFIGERYKGLLSIAWDEEHFRKQEASE